MNFLKTILNDLMKNFLLAFFLFLLLCVAHADSSNDANMWFVMAKYNYFERFDYYNAYKCLKRSLDIQKDFKPALKLKDEMGELYPFFVKLDKPLPKPIIKIAKPEKKVEKKPEIKKIEVTGLDDFQYKLALKELSEHRFEDAKKLLNDHLNKFPENINAYYYLFLIAMHQQDIKSMDRVMTVCVSLLPNYKGTESYRKFLELITCYREKIIIQEALLEYNSDNGLKNNAISEFRFSFLDRDSERPSYPIMKKLDLVVLKASDYLKYIPKCPSGGEYSIENGRVICSYHDRLYEMPVNPQEKAEKNISLADKNNAYFRIRMARKFIREKRYYRALSEANKAMEYNKYDFRVYDVISQSYYFLNKKTKALEYARNAQKMAVDEPMVYNNLGTIYLSLGKYKDAISTLLHGLAIRKSDYDLNYNLGLAYINNNELEKGKHYFEIAKTVNPNSPGVYFQLGRVYQKLNNNKEAKSTYKKLLHLVPGDGKLYNMVESIIENIK